MRTCPLEWWYCSVCGTRCNSLVCTGQTPPWIRRDKVIWSVGILLTQNIYIYTILNYIHIYIYLGVAEVAQDMWVNSETMWNWRTTWLNLDDRKQNTWIQLHLVQHTNPHISLWRQPKAVHPKSALEARQQKGKSLISLTGHPSWMHPHPLPSGLST